MVKDYVTSLAEIRAEQRKGHVWTAYLEKRTGGLVTSYARYVWNPHHSRSLVQVTVGAFSEGKNRKKSSVQAAETSSLPVSAAISSLESKLGHGYAFTEPKGSIVVSNVRSFTERREAIEQPSRSVPPDFVDPYDRILRIDLDLDSGQWSAFDSLDLREANFILSLDSHGAADLYAERPRRRLKKKGRVVRYELSPPES